ncbi:MAG: amidase [Gemmatimonadales bacterium]
MKRRAFLQSATVAGAVPLLGPRGVNPAVHSPDTSNAMTHRGELDERSLDELQLGMTRGDWTAERLVELYRAQVALRDAPRAGIHAVIEMNPDAEAIARDLDRERRAGFVRGPLHGIPVMLKDNIDTGDRMQTTAGSLALVGAPAPRDAFLVGRLRAAGAVVLGKTNLSEWANFRSSRSSSGWSSRGGQTRNPHVLDRNPCGSSSGSGAAVAASLCAIAIGTETDGSIVCPASANGVVGLKPTVGLWSRSGIIPISATQDTAGPMGRTVRDVATLLGALAGVDPRDPRTAEAVGHAHADYTRFLDPDGLRGRRIGVLRRAFGFHEAVDRLMEEALAAMRDAGAILVDPVEINAPRGIGGLEGQLLRMEFKTGLDRYLAARGSTVAVHSLRDVIAFNEAHAARTMPYFGQETLLEAEAGQGTDEPGYAETRARLLEGARRDGIDATLAKDRLYAIVAPTGGPAWVTDVLNGDHFGGGSSGHAARAGYPNITVPAGQVHGLPVGISFFSTAWREPELLGMAHAFEQHTHRRRPPQYLASLVTEGP